MTETRHADRAMQPRQTFALWLGMIGPPLLWLTQFQIRYSFAGAPPGSKRHVVVVATGLLSLVLLALLGAMSLRHARLAAASPLDASVGITSRIRFMAVLGIMTSALFFLVTLAQTIVHFFIPPGEI